jgi:tetratricopeptide (TPR) repeat protein
MPVKIIKKLLDQGKEISVTTQSELPFWDAPPKEQPYFMQVVGATKQQSWNELKKITAKWIKEEPQEIEALYHHGYSFYELKDFTSAKTLLQKVIKQNNKHALAYLHLYKIAIIEKQEDDIGYYKSRIIKLDDSLINQE